MEFSIEESTEFTGQCDAEWTIGRCRLIDPKFFFDAERKQCIRKIMGDCNGDLALFNNEESCLRTCLQVQN